MNELERAKLLVKSNELEKQRDGLRRKLADKQQFHSAAWAEYGSELCAGGMQGEEAAIQREIDAASSELALVREVLEGTIDISDERPGALRADAAMAKAHADMMMTKHAELSARADIVERLRDYIK